MGMIPQFIGAFLFSSLVMVGGSLLWPVIVKSNRPPLLEAVHDKVVETDIGKNIDSVLGTYATGDVSQVVGSASSQVASQVGAAVQKKVEDTVTVRVIEEVIKRFDTLPPENKEQVKAIICKPAD